MAHATNRNENNKWHKGKLFCMITAELNVIKCVWIYWHLPHRDIKKKKHLKVTHILFNEKATCRIKLYFNVQEVAILYNTRASPWLSRELGIDLHGLLLLIPTEFLSHLVNTLWCFLCLSLQLQVPLHLFREHFWRNMTNATTPLVNVAICCAFSHLLNLSHLKLDHTLNHYIWTP